MAGPWRTYLGTVSEETVGWAASDHAAARVEDESSMCAVEAHGG